MDIKSIKSDYNRTKSQLAQLTDRQYYSDEEEAKRRPALEQELARLDRELIAAANNLDVAE